MEISIKYRTPDIERYFLNREDECRILKINIEEGIYEYKIISITFEWLDKIHSIEIEDKRIDINNIIDSIKKELEKINIDIEENDLNEI